MKTLESNSLAAIKFALNWQSPEASHTELFYAPNVNMWRDIFPVAVEKEIIGAKENTTVTFTLEPGAAVPHFSPRKLLDISPQQLREIHISGRSIEFKPGRFYPAGLLRNVPGVFPQTLSPFRVIELDDDTIRVDLNHPLCRKTLELQMEILSISQPAVERGGRCTDWLETLTQHGPGMQARADSRKTCFESTDSYQRPDDEDDSWFYKAPRLVGHIDSRASSLLQGIYALFLNKKGRVLDLMSSVQSHLPQDLQLETTGLGLNQVELKKNPALSRHVVHDLNRAVLLPFGNNSYDAVVCSLSIEYLINPREIINEISRVLVPGGLVLISFSNRWFPPKVTRLWLELHDFERLGLVLDYILESGHFSDLRTFSARNWPRPPDDRHSAELATSDPVFVVAASNNLQ